MNATSRAINIIKKFEGFRNKSYQDSVGVWTIGYGTTKNVKSGDICTEKQAEEWLRRDLAEFELAINYLVKVPLNQNQFDALCVFTYNLGTTELAESNLLKFLNQGDYNNAGKRILLYNKAGDKVLLGLERRRKAEFELWNESL
jgi:lysozyme